MSGFFKGLPLQGVSRDSTKNIRRRHFSCGRICSRPYNLISQAFCKTFNSELLMCQLWKNWQSVWTRESWTSWMKYERKITKPKKIKHFVQMENTLRNMIFIIQFQKWNFIRIIFLSFINKKKLLQKCSFQCAQVSIRNKKSSSYKSVSGLPLNIDVLVQVLAKNSIKTYTCHELRLQYED